MHHQGFARLYEVSVSRCLGYRVQRNTCRHLEDRLEDQLAGHLARHVYPMRHQAFARLYEASVSRRFPHCK